MASPRYCQICHDQPVAYRVRLPSGREGFYCLKCGDERTWTLDEAGYDYLVERVADGAHFHVPRQRPHLRVVEPDERGHPPRRPLLDHLRRWVRR